MPIMSGHVGDLSPHQAEILEKFRASVKDVLKPKQGDHYLLRWLRARNFDAKKAEEMLRDAIVWRQQIGADRIFEDYNEPEVLIKYRTGGIVGRDKHGCPIYIDPYGLVDMKGIVRSAKKQDIVRSFVKVMENILKICEEEAEKNNQQDKQELLLIYDLKGVGLKHLAKPSVDLYLTLVDLAERRYPETLRKVFVINSPKIFPIIWSLVKPLLHEATASKVHLLGSNYSHALLQEVNPDQLPACYGGTLTDADGDPRCKTWICQGGTVPKEYYIQTNTTNAMTTETIGRGSSLQLEFVVHVPNSVIRYEYHTEGYDIGFGVFRKTSAERQKAAEMVSVLETTRSNSHFVPEDGYVECSCAGTYVVRFDNTYSWTRSKKIHYIIEVLEPNESEILVEEEEEEEVRGGELASKETT